MDDPQEMIRALAHDLWVEDGQQHGKSEFYWWKAERRLAESGDLDTSQQASDIELPPVIAGLPVH